MVFSHRAGEARVSRIEVEVLSRLHEPAAQWFTHDFRSVKADCALVRVVTDGGLTGVGESCPYGEPMLIKGWIEWLSKAMVGRTLEEAWQFARPTGRAWDHDCAVGGLDCAFWDVLGKLEDRPTCELFGVDTAPESVPVYASGGCLYDWRVDPHDLIDEVCKYADAGFTTCKIRVGTKWEWDNVDASRFVALMQDLRREVGEDFALALDGNQRLTRTEAGIVARGIDDLGFAWFEDPFPDDDVDGYAALNAEVELPISGGEQFTTVSQFRPYLEHGAFSLIHPDAGCCGLTEMMKIAAIAAEHSVSFHPHSWHNGAMAMAHAHAVAAAPLPAKVELNMHQGPLRDAILAPGLDVRSGQLTIPSGPGLGITLAEDLGERFPFIEGHYALKVVR